MDRSKAVARLVEAVDSPELVQLVEQVTFKREPVLPKSWKYRVVADFKTLFGITNIELKRGQILTLDGYDREMLRKLYERGLMIEPIA